MACKLPSEELNEIIKVLEAKYSGDELDAAVAEIKQWYNEERSKDMDSEIASEISEVASRNERAKSKYDEAKTFAMNKYLFSEGSELVVENNGKKYVETVDSIKYLKNGDIEVVGKRKKDGEAKNVYVLSNGLSDTGALISGLKNIDEVVERYVELDNDTNGLGSDNGFKYENDRKDFEKQNEDLIKNPENMKKFVKDLIETDPVKISDEHKKNLSKVIDMFIGASKNFIPEMSVYLSKKAEENGGYIELDGYNKGIYLGQSAKYRPERNAMSSAEAYVHEIIHAATEYAKQNKGVDIAKTILRLQQLREDVLKVLKVEDFLPTNAQYNTKEEYKLAKERFDYIQDKNVGLSEFIALGLSNESFAKRLGEINAYRDLDVKEKGFFNGLLSIVEKLFRLVLQSARRESKDIKADQLLLKLAMELGEANNKATIEKKKNLMRLTGDGIVYLNDSISRFIKRFETSLKDEIAKPGKDASKIAKSKWFARNAYVFLNDQEKRPVFENMLSEVAGQKPEAFLQSLIRGFRDKDELERILENFTLESGSIDRTREHEAQIVGSLVVNGFKEPLSTVEQEALTLALLDTDLSSIYETYGLEKMKKILSSPEAIQSEIDKVRKEIWKNEDKAIGNYYVSQAAGLGFYMATHMATNEAQLLNARNIGNMFNAPNQIEASKESIERIDRLATLEALKYTEYSQIEVLNKLIEKDPIGVRNINALHKSFVEKSRRELFTRKDTDGNEIDTSFNEIKGYTKEIFDADVTVEVAPVRDKAEKEKLGFKLVEKLKKNSNDTSKEEMALYVNEDHLVQSMNRTSIRYTDMGRRGTTILDVRYKGDEKQAKRLAEIDIKNINEKAYKIIENQMKAAVIDMNDENPLLPVYNEAGVAINYRYIMSKARKRSLLKQDIRAPYVLGRMEASIKDKVQTKKFNDKVLDVLFEDAKKNNKNFKKYGELSQKEYIFISPNSKETDIQQSWNVLPSSVKNRIKTEIKINVLKEAKKRGVKVRENKKGVFVVIPDAKNNSTKNTKWLDDIQKGIPMRRDMMFNYLGFRDASIADAWLVRDLPTIAKHYIRMIELIWKEIVKISKVNIIIKTPQVLIGNIVSNLALSVQMGMNPIDVMKLQFDGFRSLKKYLADETELETLKIARDAGNITKLDIKRISELENNLKDNPVRELMDAGMYQAIVEDATLGDLKTNSKITKKFDEKMEGKPEFLKNGLQYLFVTERTGFFKMMTTATQYSDFIARYALHESLKKRAEDNKPTEKDFKEINSMIRKLGASPLELIQLNPLRKFKNEKELKDTLISLKELADENLDEYGNMKKIEGVNYSKLIELVEKKYNYDRKEFVALNTTKDAFIVYGTPDSKLLQYMNDMGLVMFTKYFVRIQRVIRKSVIDHPISFLLAVLGQTAIMDVDDVHDQSIFTKDLTNIFHGPIDTLIGALYPSGLDYAEYAYKKVL